MKLSKTFTCRLLGQLGMTLYRPVLRAYEERPEEVQKWLQEEYPRIRRLARQKKALIFVGDEAGVRSDHHSGTTWAVKGKTPVVSSTGARFGFDLIPTVSAQGEFRYIAAKGWVRATQFIEFIKRLLHNMPHMVLLIVDKHPANKTKMGKRFADLVKEG